jgi:KUP system potassium uptake protein
LPASAAISPDLRHSPTLAALGVVYGDIGTSPLYAVRQSLVEFADTSEPSILGTLSLIAWTLALVVTVKYVFVIMRADNRGEGGLLALTRWCCAPRTATRGGTCGSWRRAWSAPRCSTAMASLPRRSRC